MKKTKNLELFNLIASQCSNSFRANYNQMTEQSLSTLANDIETSEQVRVDMNEFISTMLNKVALTLIQDNSINNKYSDFIYYNKPFGEIIENIYVDLIEPENYQPSTIENGGSVDPFRITIPKTKANYLKNSTKLKFRQTIFMEQLRKAFNNEYGLYDLIQKIVNTLRQSCNLSEYNLFLDTINSVFTNTQHPLKPSQMIDLGFKVYNRQSAMYLVKTIKDTIAKFLEPNNRFNQQGIIKQNTLDDIVVMINDDIANLIQVELLSSSFNSEDLGFTPSGFEGKVKVITTDNFGGLQPFIDNAGTLTKLFRVYNSYGQFTHYSKSSSGSAISSSDLQKLVLVPNYQLTGTNITKDVYCLIFDKQLPIIANELDTITTTRNEEALYTNYVLNRWISYGFNLFSNFVAIGTNSLTELVPPLTDVTPVLDISKYPNSLTNLKITPSINTSNLDDYATLSVNSGDFVGEEFEFTLTIKPIPLSEKRLLSSISFNGEELNLTSLYNSSNTSFTFKRNIKESIVNVNPIFTSFQVQIAGSNTNIVFCNLSNTLTTIIGEISSEKIKIPNEYYIVILKDELYEAFLFAKSTYQNHFFYDIKKITSTSSSSQIVTLNQRKEIFVLTLNNTSSITSTSEYFSPNFFVTSNLNITTPNNLVQYSFSNLTLSNNIRFYIFK